MKIDVLVLKLLLYMLKLLGKLSGHQSSVSLQQWKSFMNTMFGTVFIYSNHCYMNAKHLYIIICIVIHILIFKFPTLFH